MDEQTHQIVEQTAQRAAADAAEKAVKQALASLGVDANDPFEVQRDMLALRELRDMVTSDDFKADMMHLRKWRMAMDGVQNKGMLTIIGIAVSGIGAALWIGFQAILKGGN